MLRSEVAAYLGGLYGPLLAEVGLTASDTTGNLKEVLDDAGRLRGLGEEALAGPIAAAEVPPYLAVARWLCLRKIASLLALRADISLSTPAIAKSRSQPYRAVSELLDQARLEAEPYLVRTGTWTTATLTFDYLEPPLRLTG